MQILKWNNNIPIAPSYRLGILFCLGKNAYTVKLDANNIPFDEPYMILDTNRLKRNWINEK